MAFGHMPPPPSAVPLPRFAGEEPAPPLILLRLRGRGTMGSMVEGAHF
jgi:hypothetical protein